MSQSAVPAKVHPNRAIAAGVLITMGCVVNLRVGGVAGAVIFSAGLWFVLWFQAELFTGRVALPTYSWPEKLLMLGYNVLGALVAGVLTSLSLPGLRESAVTLVAGYLSANFFAIFWRAVMCGICMYCAVSRLEKYGHLPNVIYGVVLFILSGYAHSIALAGYAAIAMDIRGIYPVLLCAAGNAAGSYLMKWLVK